MKKLLLCTLILSCFTIAHAATMAKGEVLVNTLTDRMAPNVVTVTVETPTRVVSGTFCDQLEGKNIGPHQPGAGRTIGQCAYVTSAYYLGPPLDNSKNMSYDGHVLQVASSITFQDCRFNYDERIYNGTDYVLNYHYLCSEE